MTKLPVNVKGKELLKVCRKLGFVQTKTTSSHQDFKHPDGRRTSIPVHPKPIPIGTLKAILEQMKINVDDLRKLL